MNLKKSKSPVLSPEIASQMLENVFSVCQKDPGTVSLEALCAYSNYRRERFTLQRILIAVMLTVFLLLPLLFIPPHISVELSNADVNENPVYLLKVSSLIPVREVHVLMDGRTVPAYESSKGTYTIAPSENGSMSLSVTLMNLQESHTEQQVSTVDSTLPRLISSEVLPDAILLHVTDDGSGIDGTKITVSTLSGNVCSAFTFDSENGVIRINYPQESIEVQIPDVRGNVLRLVLTVQAE